MEKSQLVHPVIEKSQSACPVIEKPNQCVRSSSVVEMEILKFNFRFSVIPHPKSHPHNFLSTTKNPLYPLRARDSKTSSYPTFPQWPSVSLSATLCNSLSVSSSEHATPKRPPIQHFLCGPLCHSVQLCVIPSPCPPPSTATQKKTRAQTEPASNNISLNPYSFTILSTSPPSPILRKYTPFLNPETPSLSLTFPFTALNFLLTTTLPDASIMLMLSSSLS